MKTIGKPLKCTTSEATTYEVLSHSCLKCYFKVLDLVEDRTVGGLARLRANGLLVASIATARVTIGYEMGYV